MLMGIAAVAENRPYVQNELPPQVVSYVNENGETVYAKICDAEGNVLAEIKDKGALVLTDVAHRDVIEDAVIATRLTDAYNSVMENVHHADVECKLHDHDVKVDINAILASIHHELDAHDLVMCELYDVMLTDETAAQLAGDNYLEATFEINENEYMPLLTMFTGDGFEWMVIPMFNVSENQFTLHLPTSGTIALLMYGREVLGIGEDVERVVTIIPGTDPEEIPDGYENFTPSVSGKTAPTIVTKEGADGKKIVGYIRTAEGLDDVAVPDQNYIIVTAVAERWYNPDIQTYEHLVWGYERILEAEDVGDLFTEHDLSVIIPDHEHGTIAGLLDNALAQMGLDLTHDQLVVKDLFEVTAYGDYLHLLYDEEHYLEMTFDTDLDPEKPVLVIHSSDSKHWHVHPISEFAVNAKGELTLNMYDLGTVAFLVEAEETLNPETAVQSPN